MINISVKRYTKKFRKQIVSLYSNGKQISEIIYEYGMTRPSLYNQIKKYNSPGSFNSEDNKSNEEKEHKLLKKENAKLKMKNDILKRAAMILDQFDK